MLSVIFALSDVMGSVPLFRGDDFKGAFLIATGFGCEQLVGKGLDLQVAVHIYRRLLGLFNCVHLSPENINGHIKMDIN